MDKKSSLIAGRKSIKMVKRERKPENVSKLIGKYAKGKIIDKKCSYNSS